MKTTPRRTFLATASASAGFLATSQAPAMESPPRRNPRQIWIATVSLEGMRPNDPDALCKQLLQRMEALLPQKPDLFCLPETFTHYYGITNRLPIAEIADQAEERFLSPFAQFAKKNGCYMICPIYTKENGNLYNSAVVLNRQGITLGAYHKMHPTTDEMEDGIQPGPINPPVFQTDFGMMGIQICFDINWPDGWKRLQEQGAELIIWPSAFPGGRMANAMAWMHQCVVVTSTYNNPSRILDITGDEIAETGHFEHAVCAPVNLEKAFIHIWPYLKELDALRAQYGQDVRVIKVHPENWAIVESLSPTQSVKEMLKEFHIPLHPEHIATADRMQRERRS